MTHKFKALGLAFFAVLAMSAIAAQAASATVDHSFVSEKEKTVLTGNGITNQVFVGNGGGLVVVCTVSRFNGTVGEEKADQVEVFPEYEVCEEINSGFDIHVVNSGCTFRFESDTEETVSALHAPVALTCGHRTSAITLTDEASLCKITFSDTHEGGVSGGATVNQVLHGVTYTNGGSGTTRDVTVDATATGITYEMKGAFCELLGAEPGTYHDGTYTGKATVKGYEDVDNTPNHVYDHNNVHVGIELVTP